MFTDADLHKMPLPELTALARGVRDNAYGFADHLLAQVFIPLTMLCRDRCGYCTFAKAPARLTSPYLTPDEVLAIAQAGQAAGCAEALFTLGERPELRYPVAKQWLADNNYSSTVDYLAAMCRLVLEETGLLPHANAGALYAEELAILRPVAASQGTAATSPAAIANPLNIDAFNGAIGLPMPSTDIVIRDDDGRDLKLGDAGELCIKGPQVMAGYWNRPDETEKVMTADGFLRTGDIARVDERGFLYVGRSQEGHDQRLRLQRLPERNRGRSDGAPRRPRGGRGRRRGREDRRGSQARGRAHTSV